MPRPTLQLIADKAGVSKMTVSRVLRNHPNCSRETSARVRAIAEELNYKKHPLVSALMADLRYKKEPQFKPIIALLHYDQPKTNPHPNSVNMRNGVWESANMQGYDINEFYLRDEGMTTKRMMQIFETRGIRGIIFEHPATPNVTLDVDLSDYACVAIKYALTHPVLHRIETSQFGSLLLAMEKLFEYGYRRPGLVLPEYSESISQYRRTGATLYAQQAIPMEDRLPILETDFEDTENLAGWLELHKPDVILSQSPQLYHKLQTMGYHIPHDLGFIHLGLSSRKDQFAGIDPNWEEMGRIAANQIIDQLNRNEVGVPKHPLVTLIQGDWVDGETLPRIGGTKREKQRAKSLKV